MFGRDTALGMVDRGILRWQLTAECWNSALPATTVMLRDRGSDRARTSGCPVRQQDSGARIAIAGLYGRWYIVEPGAGDEY
jgi:hypothetical protein